MIDVKQAVAAAEKYAVDALGTSDLLLEEIVSDQDKFRITISFPNRRPHPLLSGRPNLSSIPSRYRDREYKVFVVNKESGSVDGMTIRTLAEYE